MSAAVTLAATVTARSAVGASVRWTSIISGRRRTPLITRWGTRIVTRWRTTVVTRRWTTVVTRRGTTVVTGRRRAARPKIPLPESTTRRRHRRATIIAFDAQHAAGAGVRIEPKHATVGCHPFEAITRVAGGSYIGALHVGKAAWPLAANAVHDLIQRTDLPILDALPGTIGLCGGGLGGRGRTQQEQCKYGCKIPHGGNFYAAAHELRMNAPASLRSAIPRQYTHRHKGSPMRNKPNPALDAVSRVPPLLAGPVSSVSARGVKRPRGSLFAGADCGGRDSTVHGLFPSSRDCLTGLAAPNATFVLIGAMFESGLTDAMRRTRFRCNFSVINC